MTKSDMQNILDFDREVTGENDINGWNSKTDLY
jgi:hypothetical protein